MKYSLTKLRSMSLSALGDTHNQLNLRIKATDDKLIKEQLRENIQTLLYVMALKKQGR